MAFVHLHTHSHYSLLESTVKPIDMVARAKELGMPALAMTDLGNMFGAIDFYFNAKNAGIKPILGAEIYYVTGTRHDKNKVLKRIQADTSANQDSRLFHLVLLCKDQEGYQNLCQLITLSYSEGFLNKPRADRELIEKYSKGLIALTGGLKGEFGYYGATLRPDRAEESLAWLKQTFKDDLYLEVQENGLPEQSSINRLALELSQKYEAPLVATSETFYLKPEQAEAQEVLMCIGAGRTLDESRNVRLVPDTFWFKDEETMKQEFSWAPEAITNTLLVAEKCNFNFSLKDSDGKQIYHLPEFKHELKIEDAIRNASRDGLKERFKEPQYASLLQAADWKQKYKEYEERLELELDMIIKTGFSGYFMVVADFIGFAKASGIPVGPGRGSGAGSLVAYALKITDVDPIKFNLLFERFINPERISLPDFDVDFCQERRQEVIEYVVQKYGKEKVSQIATFGKLLAKGVVRDVSRVLGYSFSEVDPIAKLIPETLGITLETAFAREEKLGQLADNDPRIAKLFAIARQLEGLNRHASVHAAGVVITNRPLYEYCPMFTGKEGESVIQYDKDFAEKIGLVKFDFLGLKTLTVIDNAVKFIRETQAGRGEAPPFELDKINYEDPNVFALIASGDTDGIFQLESSGMKDLCQRVVPSNLEDITAINAIYRPGPLNSGMVDDYINRKHGKTEFTYELPQLKDILEETYGVIVYQEQVMRVARVLANYSLGEADILRRAMGKKKPEEMAKQKDKFVQGCLDNKISKDIAVRIFDLLAKFAEYGFNKSHSAAYGVLSYQTAFLKTYYPAQFMAAMLATEMHDTDKLAHYISDSKNHGLAILPPDVNESKKTFSVVEVEKGKMGIRFGLEAIKGVGSVAVDAILQEREERGLFKSFVDFCNRVTLRKVNKKVLESLIASGGFDRISEENRATLFASVESVIAQSSKLQEQSDLGQVSFFDQYTPEAFKLETSSTFSFNKVPEWTDSKKLQMEKQLVGFYVSGHPLDKWWDLAKDFCTGSIDWILENYPRMKEEISKKPKPAPSKNSWRRDEGPRWDVATAAMVSSVKEITTKKGAKMAFAVLESITSKIEVVCFPEAYEKFKPLLQQSIDECLPFIFTGNVSLDEETPKLFLKTVEHIAELQNKKIQAVILRLDPSRIDTEKLAQLRAALIKHGGKTATFLEYEGSVSGAGFTSRHSLPKELFVKPSAEFAHEISKLFGENSLKFLS